MVCVVTVSTVSNPIVVRAGTALESIQKDTHDIITDRMLGMYVFTRYIPTRRSKYTSHSKQGNIPEMNN